MLSEIKEILELIEAEKHHLDETVIGALLEGVRFEDILYINATPALLIRSLICSSGICEY